MISENRLKEAEKYYQKLEKKRCRLENPNATAQEPCHGCPDRNTPKCNTEHCLIEDPDCRDEQLHWKRIAYEFRHAPGTMGSFSFSLCEAIVRADLANTERLKKAYPELVRWIQEADL